MAYKIREIILYFSGRKLDITVDNLCIYSYEDRGKTTNNKIGKLIIFFFLPFTKIGVSCVLSSGLSYSKHTKFIISTLINKTNNKNLLKS